MAQPAMKGADVEDLVLNYNPEQPDERFKQAGVEAAFLTASQRLPAAVPWPNNFPKATPLSKAPAETDDLSQFRGYDAIVMTWTAAEAAALASLFTPGHPTLEWYEYRHGISAYLPLVTGSRAPFNDSSSDMARYYHSLGLYFPCTIGDKRILLFKSGLHLDYDGPQIPLKKLTAELLNTIQPKVLITTGTGGGIGQEVLLGDVVIASATRFFCTSQFKNEPWKSASFQTSPVSQQALAAITPQLTKVNAAKIQGGRQEPKLWHGSGANIVTTDFFGFDDSTNHYGLETLGRACDMGDAMIGLTMQGFPGIDWYAIRNASDPQIPNPSGDLAAAKQQAGQIYAKYGAFTTAASVIATWAVLSN
jgi:Phosphorylase superfamily